MDFDRNDIQRRSCGFLILRNHNGRKQFLLMEHADRWDLPKGHVDPGETDIQCALRELLEETGIEVEDIEIDPDFHFSNLYWIHKGKNEILKELVIFMGTLEKDVPIEVTEHIGYQWFNWTPPHLIERKNVDAVLSHYENHLAAKSSG